jgi:hypothetical protein
MPTAPFCRAAMATATATMSPLARHQIRSVARVQASRPRRALSPPTPGPQTRQPPGESSQPPFRGVSYASPTVASASSDVSRPRRGTNSPRSAVAMHRTLPVPAAGAAGLAARHACESHCPPRGAQKPTVSSPPGGGQGRQRQRSPRIHRRTRPRRAALRDLAVVRPKLTAMQGLGHHVRRVGDHVASARTAARTSFRSRPFLIG